MKTIFFYEAFEEETIALKKFLPKNIDADFSWKTIQEHGEKNPPAKIISIRTQSQIPTDWANSIDAIISRSTGYDHVNEYRKITGKNLPAGYLPLYCSRSVAEQALLMWMALLRKLPKQVRQFKTFHRDGITGKECDKKVLAVVGVGNIGYEIVKIGKGLNMDVLGVDIVKKRDDVNYVSHEDAIQKADVIVCAMNLTEENEGYFNLERLSSAKPGAVFINIARGELSPAADLLKLLETKKLGAVGLDVYNFEKELAGVLRSNINSDNNEVRAVLKLAERNDVILSPHNAFNTEEAVERKSEQTAEQLMNFLEKGEFKWKVEEI